MTARCFDEERLQAFVDKRLTDAEMALAESHLDTCGECLKLFAEVARCLARTHPSEDASPAPAEPDLLASGTAVGRYTVLAPIGAGGMGLVYEAYDPELDRKIALKLVRTGGSDPGGSTRARVQREARAIARLAHPNVVSVFDVGVHAGEVFLAMELIDGGTLRDTLARKPHGWKEILELFVQAGRGLAAAHAVGLVHRDFKPDNVLIGSDGRGRVCDFGLARAEQAIEETARGHAESHDARATAQTMTRTGTVLGTPAYMAPEQIDGERADARADIFSFAVALYEALYGARPFEGNTLGELRASIAAGRVREAPAGTSVPDVLRACVLRGLAADRGGRYQTMDAMLEALEACASPARARWSRAWLPAAVIAAVVLGSAVVIFVAARNAGAPTSAAEAIATTRASSGAATAEAPPPSAQSDSAISFQPKRLRRITFAEGCEEYPSFFPDSRRVVFDGTVGPSSALFVLDLDTGSLLRITSVEGWDFAAAVSPDGKHIAFLRSVNETAGTYVMDAEGKSEPRLIAKGTKRPSWTPSSDAIWAGEMKQPSKYDLEGRVLRTFTVPPTYIAGQSIELDDGRLVVNFPYQHDAAQGAVGIYGGEKLTWLAEGTTGEILALTPNRRTVFAVRNTPTNEPELLALPLAGGPAQSLMSTGILPRKGFQFAPNGSSVVWSTCRGVAALAKLDAEARLIPLARSADWQELDVAWIPGTHSVIALSERGGLARPWIVDLSEKTTPREIPLTGVDPFELAVSPDGKSLVVVLDGKGITFVDIAGTEASRPLTTNAADLDVAFTRDGSEVLFSRLRSDGATQIMAVSRTGTEREFLERGTRDPGVSVASGKIAYLAGTRDKELLPMLYDPRTHAKTPLSSSLALGLYAHPQFSADGKRIALIRGGKEIVEVETATGKILRTINAGTDQIKRVVYAGDDLLVVRAQWLGDLWMADGPF